MCRRDSLKSILNENSSEIKPEFIDYAKAIKTDKIGEKTVSFVANKYNDIAPVSYTHLDVYKRQTPDTGSYVIYSSAMKRLAVKLSKICNDLRLLSSGPRAGFFEINLPPMQPGSSIMPGKVNPVIPEVVNQVCYKVIGNDLTVTFASEAGQLLSLIHI